MSASRFLWFFCGVHLNPWALVKDHTQENLDSIDRSFSPVLLSLWLLPLAQCLPLIILPALCFSWCVILRTTAFLLPSLLNSLSSVPAFHPPRRRPFLTPAFLQLCSLRSWNVCEHPVLSYQPIGKLGLPTFKPSSSKHCLSSCSWTSRNAQFSSSAMNSFTLIFLDNKHLLKTQEQTRLLHFLGSWQPSWVSLYHHQQIQKHNSV